MTQEHLAEASGLSARTIIRAEQGRPISDEAMRAICAALDCDVASIPVVDGKQEPSPSTSAFPPPHRSPCPATAHCGGSGWFDVAMAVSMLLVAVGTTVSDLAWSGTPAVDRLGMMVGAIVLACVSVVGVVECAHRGVPPTRPGALLWGPVCATLSFGLMVPVDADGSSVGAATAMHLWRLAQWAAG
jgi:hypothetical protein